MKWLFQILVVLLAGIAASCGPASKTVADKSSAANDTIRIANDELEYEIMIIDPGFNSWFISYAKPRNFYPQSYLEARNVVWVTEWNNRYLDVTARRKGLYEMPIDYRAGIDYGYEVNYMLYNYLTYFQLTNGIRLGGFAPRR